MNRHIEYQEISNSLRVLSVDAVQNAKSGHPGMPLGMADVATVLFAEFFNFNPYDSEWINRDRFVLSNGHGSILLYSILYFMKYITLDDLRKFRKIHSITPGHPEYGYTPGVDATTGPLGQGLGCAVGMAIAESILSNRFGQKIFNHYTYAMVGDGCLMEGISHEAASLAGHLNLNKLIVFFDDNQISIDGSTSLSTSDDVVLRFKSYGWNVEKIDGHNYTQITNAIKKAHHSDKPSIICCKTIIGKYVANRENLSAAHSGPFHDSEIKDMKQLLNHNFEPFTVSKNTEKLWKEIIDKAHIKYKNWLLVVTQENFDLNSYQKIVSLDNDTIFDLEVLKQEINKQNLHESTRQSSGKILNYLTKKIPELIGGSADLTESNFTKTNTMQVFDKINREGTYIHYGIREHAMAACMNGIALYGGLIPYGGTFLTFSDYCRPSIRLSALMKKQVIYIMTHDSIGLGEDGPTHQPIEHLASLRAIPNLYVFRPADAIEVLECWELALGALHTPSIIVLTRQKVSRSREKYVKENLSRYGAYIINEYKEELNVTIFATGSEVNIALKAQSILHRNNIGTRIVSVPCWELFSEQDKLYQSTILDNNSLKAAIEAASSFGWSQYIGQNGIFIGIDSFGISGSSDSLYEYFNITAEKLVEEIMKKLK